MSRKLTKEAIVAAGLDTLDADGLDGLTVRKVAARLDVQAPALYWHVRDKQQLLDEMATEIWRQILTGLDTRPPDEPWRQALTAFAATTRAALLSHRDGAKMVAGTYLTDDGLRDQQESRFAVLVRAGFSPRDAARIYSLLYNFIIGYCIEEQAVKQTEAAGDDRYSPERRAERLDAEKHPLTAETGDEIFGDPDARFADRVALILDVAGRLVPGSEAEVS